MNSRILKYSVQIGEETTIPLPLEAPILHVACQSSDESVEFWALVDAEQEASERKFIILGTGMYIRKDHVYKVYRGTALSPGGFVWHLFEIVEQ